jgi:pyruvate decarboxylase
MLRRGVHPYIFVLNNDGYEIERQIHGWTAEYNNIQLYDHQLLLPFLAGKKCPVSISLHISIDQDRPPQQRDYTGQAGRAMLKSAILILQTKHQSYEVHTPTELSDLLNDTEFQKADRLRLIEVYMPRGDAPEGLVKQAKLTADANAKA